MRDFQDRGESHRQRLGIDGTAGDAQDVPHPYIADAPYGAWCVVCGLAKAYRRHPPPDLLRTLAALERRGLIVHHGWAHGWERTPAGDAALSFAADPVHGPADLADHLHQETNR